MNLTLKIDENLFACDLNNHLIDLFFIDQSQRHFIQLFQKLISVGLTELDSTKLNEAFSNDEKALLKRLELLTSISNKEIIARWLDVLLHLDKDFLYDNIQRAYDAYKDVYYTTDDLFYLIRGCHLVRKAKSIFTNKLEAIFDIAKTAFFRAQTPHLQKLLLIEMVAIFGVDKCQQEFQQYLENQIREYTEHNKYSEARRCIESLNVLKALNTVDTKIKMAETYELEGDYKVSQKKPNARNSMLADTFLKGLKQIESLPGCDSIRKRLQEKLKVEQRENYETLKMMGINMYPPINVDRIQEFVSHLKIDSYLTAFKELITIPIPQTSYLSDKKESNNDFFSQAFPTQARINAQGATIAQQTIKEANISLRRQYCREKILLFIYFTKARMDVFGCVTEELIERLLIRSKSPFIPKDRLLFYTMGLAEGFRNNFINAAHILIPQIENSCRYIANNNGINVTKLEDDLQHESMLGGCLEKLRPLADTEYIDELKSFLVDGNDINFRNEICHGLISSNSAQKYGQYLWWLVLKILFNIDQVFPDLGNNKSESTKV